MRVNVFEADHGDDLDWHVNEEHGDAFSWRKATSLEEVPCQYLVTILLGRG